MYIFAMHSSLPIFRGFNYPRYSQSSFYSPANRCYAAKSLTSMTSRRPNDGTMMAAVVYKAGGPEVFKVEKRQIPKPVSD